MSDLATWLTVHPAVLWEQLYYTWGEKNICFYHGVRAEWPALFSTAPA